jgi:hypothetical protein
MPQRRHRREDKIAYLGIAFALLKVHEQGFHTSSRRSRSPDHAKATFDPLDSFSPKPTKVAIFAEKTDWAQMVKYWQEADAGGYTLTVSEYAPGTTDFTVDPPGQRRGCQSCQL